MSFDDVCVLDECTRELKGAKCLISMLESAAYEDASTIGYYESGISVIWGILNHSIERLENLTRAMEKEYKEQPPQTPARETQAAAKR